MKLYIANEHYFNHYIVADTMKEAKEIYEKKKYPPTTVHFKCIGNLDKKRIIHIEEIEHRTMRDSDYDQ